MEPGKLKLEMMRLWKETFHDSDEYIQLVFDAYFNPDNVEYEEHEGRVVSALLGVPYNVGWNQSILKGMYLCGLATDPKHRHRGIMSALINRAEQTAKRNGFDFTFLIPADNGLRRYYNDRNYVNGSYIIHNRYTSIHDFDREYIAILEKEEKRIQDMKKAYFNGIKIRKPELKNTHEVEKIIRFINSCETSTSYVCLRHSPQDIITIIEENIISRGDIIIAIAPDENICGIAFAFTDMRGNIIVRHIFHSDIASRYKILSSLKKEYPQLTLVVEDFPEESFRRGIWSENVVAANGAYHDKNLAEVEKIYKVSNHATPYAMVKFLNEDHIQEFLATRSGEAKYSILAREGESVYKYVVNHGGFKKESVKIEGDHQVVFSKKQLEEIICRRPSDDNIVLEAFGIPRLPLNLTLLLD